MSIFDAIKNSVLQGFDTNITAMDILLGTEPKQAEETAAVETLSEENTAETPAEVPAEVPDAGENSAEETKHES